MTPILELRNIDYSYHTLDGETKALSNISFTLTKGEFVSVVGPSGCGKSTLLSLIDGLMQPESGEMLLKGQPLTENSDQIGYMLQHDHLFEWRSIWRNVLLGAEISGRLTPETKRHAKAMLEQYGNTRSSVVLKQFARSRPSELSGGMRQAGRPHPNSAHGTGASAPPTSLSPPWTTRPGSTVSDDIGQIIRRSGKTALLVTHDLSEAVSLADRVIILTRRPARIARIIPVTFDLADDTPGPEKCTRIQNLF